MKAAAGIHAAAVGRTHTALQVVVVDHAAHTEVEDAVVEGAGAWKAAKRFSIINNHVCCVFNRISKCFW